MKAIITLRRTCNYRLYRYDKVDARLHQQINVTGMIWNHALALQKRYYMWYYRHLGERWHGTGIISFASTGNPV